MLELGAAERSAETNSAVPYARDLAYVSAVSEMVWLAPMIATSAAACVIALVCGFGMIPGDVAVGYAWRGAMFVPILVGVALAEFITRSFIDGKPGGRMVLARLSYRLGSPDRALATFAPILLLVALSASLGVMKMMLPVFRPFSWDSIFARADQILFWNHQPWQLTHAIFGSAWSTLVIDRIYTFWVYLLPVAISAVALFAPSYERARFFLSYALVISVIGIAGAYAFSSAGPCYAPMLTQSLSGQFQPLVDRLHAMSGNELLWAVEWQDLLWKGYQNNWYGVGLGISAMPSIHVALAVLYACILNQFALFFRLAGWLFATVIFIGSIHLGWHYAIDGLVSGAATLVIWTVVSAYLRLRGYSARSNP